MAPQDLRGLREKRGERELTWFVLFVWLIWFIWLVSFNQQPDRPDRLNKQVRLAAFISSLLEEFRFDQVADPVCRID
jgi:hypothetical protein